MAALSRRAFLGLAAGATAGGVLAPFASTRTAGSAEAASAGSLSSIKHVVIVMQENRSFDHYFGTLQGVRGFGDRSTILQSAGLSIFNQKNGMARQYPWHMSNTVPASGQSAETTAQCSLDLPHGWSDQHSAWNSGRMDNWVSAKSAIQTLGHLDRTDIPFHYALADA